MHQEIVDALKRQELLKGAKIYAHPVSADVSRLTITFGKLGGAELIAAKKAAGETINRACLEKSLNCGPLATGAEYQYWISKKPPHSSER